jgi:hypothetical protein
VTQLCLKSILILLSASLLSCEKPSSISGVVANGLGDPIQDAKVAIENTQFETRSDSNGHYEIGFAPGRFVVSISADRYLSKKVTFDISQRTSVPAAPVTLIPMPVVSDWEALLRTDILKQPIQDFIGETVRIENLADLVSTTVHEFKQTAEDEVIGSVTHRWRAKKTFSQPGTVSRLMVFLSREDRHSGEGWDQNFTIRLKFSAPKAWKWEETVPL